MSPKNKKILPIGFECFSKPLDAFLRYVPLPYADGDFKDVKVRKKKEHPPPLKDPKNQRDI